MSTLTVEVESRFIGNTSRNVDLDSVWLEILEERITVAELIRCTVEEQICTMMEKRKLEALETERLLAQRYLAPSEIEAKAQQGVVRYPHINPSRKTTIDPGLQVQRAQESFRAGNYLILIDGQQAESLEEEWVLTSTAKITFLRLMPLVGG